VLDAAAIQSVTGLKGVLNQTEGTFRIAKARDDVPVTVEQTRLAPFMGLTSWAAFLPHGKDHAMVMGDMVLFEDEVNPVMSAALNAGLESEVFGQKGEAKEGIYKVTVGRVVQMAGMDVGNTMGVNTWAAFARTPDDALAVGDFAVLEKELQTVLKTLRGANINIVAIHQHMTGENPRMIFLHYYGRGNTLDLARGIKAAINTQALAANP
jgi:Domain of Unknown Function (DUF1259)